MSVLVVLDTVALGLMAVLLVALLRSHAEILRRAHVDQAVRETEPSGTVEGGRLPRLRPDATPAFDIAGSTLSGGAVAISATGGQSRLLAFLSSGCLTCQRLWHGLPHALQEALPLGAQIVAVTKDREYESPSRLRELADSRVPLVMSSQAWTDYRVELSPYFIFIDGHQGRVVSEGSAESWDQVFSLLRDSFEDLAMAQTTSGGSVAVEGE